MNRFGCLGLAFMIAGASVPAYAQAEVQISVPSDPRAEYFVVDMHSEDQHTVIITTRREGPSGTSYATRHVECAPLMTGYLSEGDTMEELAFRMKTSVELNSPVLESISGVVSQFACDNR